MGQLYNCAENPTLIIPHVKIYNLLGYFSDICLEDSQGYASKSKSPSFILVPLTPTMTGSLFLCQMIPLMMTFTLLSGQKSSANKYFTICHKNFKTLLGISFSGYCHAEEASASSAPFSMSLPRHTVVNFHVWCLRLTKHPQFNSSIFLLNFFLLVWVTLWGLFCGGFLVGFFFVLLLLL